MNQLSRAARRGSAVEQSAYFPVSGGLLIRTISFWEEIRIPFRAGQNRIPPSRPNAKPIITPALAHRIGRGSSRIQR